MRIGRTTLLCVLVLSARVGSQELREELCTPGPGCSLDTLEIEFESTGTSTIAAREVPAGEPIRMWVVLVVDSTSIGPQGWSYGVSHDSEFLSLVPESVTTNGTDAREAVVTPNFDVTRAVPGGFISAVVLSFVTPTVLASGRSTLARAAYDPVGEVPDSGTVIRLVDREIGAEGSPPVEINLTIEGRSHFPHAVVHGLVAAGGAPSFSRGDSNADGAVSVADAVFSLNYLFRGGAAPTCVDAADANDDGRIELPDAVYTLLLLFLAGPEFPVPGRLDCGADPTSDALTCESFPPCA